MVSITGFEPLDLIIMESDEKANKIINCIRETPTELVPSALQNLIYKDMEVGIFEDLTGNDLARIEDVLNEKGYSLYRD